MKVQAFICDHCGAVITDAEQVYGVRNFEDMFDKMKSYPTIAAAKADIHYCHTCVTKNVIDRVDFLCNRKREGEQAYTNTFNELSLALRQSTVTRWRTKNKKG